MDSPERSTTERDGYPTNDAWEDRQTLERGAVVEVREPGLEPWAGMVLTVKWSSVSGWHVEVRRNDSYMVWSVPLQYVFPG